MWQDNLRLPLLFPVSLGVVLLVVFVHAIIALDGSTLSAMRVLGVGCRPATDY